jgi:hypothetical protein
VYTHTHNCLHSAGIDTTIKDSWLCFRRVIRRGAVARRFGPGIHCGRFYKNNCLYGLIRFIGRIAEKFIHADMCMAFAGRQFFIRSFVNTCLFFAIALCCLGGIARRQLTLQVSQLPCILCCKKQGNEQYGNNFFQLQP